MLFSAERIQRLAPDVVLDIVAELAYWKSCYPYRHFFSHHHSFETYIPTLEFGYDAYLRHHRQGLGVVMPELEARYRLFPEHQRIAWGDAALMVEATWQRIGGGAVA